MRRNIILFFGVGMAILQFATIGSPNISAQVAAGDEPKQNSASVLTLEEAQQIASRDNPEIRLALQRVRLAQSKVSAAGALDDPMFQYRNWGTPLRQPWNWNQSQQMFMLEQTFPGGRKRSLKSEIAGTEIKVSQAELETVRQDVAARLRKTFAELLRNREELQFHERQAGFLKQTLQATLAKYTVGKAPQQDVLKSQIVLTKLSEHLIGLEQQRDSSIAELNSLLGRNPASPVEVRGTYAAVSELPSLALLQTAAIEHRPELAALRARVGVAESQQHAASLNRKPDWTIGAGYMLMPDGTSNRNAYMAEVSVNLPWLNSRKHDGEIAEAAATTAVANAELDTERAAVFLQIQEALIAASSAKRTLELYRDTLLPQADATFRSATVSYTNNQTDFLSLIDSENMLLDLRTSYAKTAAEYDTRIADLERAVGAPVSEPELTAEVKQ